MVKSRVGKVSSLKLSAIRILEAIRGRCQFKIFSRAATMVSWLARTAQKLAPMRSAKLLDGPMALPENSPPKSITFKTLLRFSPSA
jgi:hypothetical protein